MTQADPGERRAIDARFSPLFQRGYPAAGTKSRSSAPEDRVARPVQPLPPPSPAAASSALDDERDLRGADPGVDDRFLDAGRGEPPQPSATVPIAPFPATPLGYVRILRIRLTTLLTLLSAVLAAASVGAFYWSWNAQRNTAFFSGDGTIGTDTAALFATTQFAAATAPLVFAVGLGTAIAALVLTASARRNR